MPTRAEPQPAWPERYELLDGLRGIAALGVVLHHIGVFAIGNFAVMVFFVISGYCITASADSCWRSRASFREFMLRRVRRIYPPYLLAVLFFVATRLVKAATGPGGSFDPTALDWLQNLTLTQWLSDLAHPIPWPSQNRTLFVAAFWSLNYEEQFYLVIGLGLVLARRLHVPLVRTILTLAAVGLAWNWIVPGNWICGLFIEYWDHFAFGACLFLALCRCTAPRQRWMFGALALAIALACLLRVALDPVDAVDRLRAMVELPFVAGVALALYFLRPLSRAISLSFAWRPIAALGAISYSLYLVHQFNLTLVDSVAHRLLPGDAPRAVVVLLVVTLHIGVATLFWWACERPFQRRNRPPAARLPVPALETPRAA